MNPLDIAARAVQHARRCRRIRGSPLPKAVRRKVLGTYLRWTFFPGFAFRRTGGWKRARLLDFRVAAISTHDLRFLFEEIFVELPYFFRASRPEPLIVDAGSNIGVSILFFKTIYPRARVLGFEPGPGAFALLQENLKANELPDVDVHDAALGRTEGTVDFYVDPEDPGSLLMSTVRDRLPKERRTVRQVRLSSFVHEDVDFLKLDVEGAEADVLEDLIASGAIAHIRQMAVEYHHHIQPERDALGVFLSRLEEHGFGYHISAACPEGATESGGRAFQDIHIFAYRKGG